VGVSLSEIHISRQDILVFKYVRYSISEQHIFHMVADIVSYIS